MTEQLLLRFDEAGGSRAVVLQDDDRVAYAYLLNHDSIVGDVWLYNVLPTPSEPQWNDPSQLPFLNPSLYCGADQSWRLTTESAISLRWFALGVEVVVDGILIARLEEGRSPGWSRFAIRPGPLALPLLSNDPSN